MLLQNLYTIVSISSEENKYRAYIELNPLHAVYEGHFPDNPVLPGVCTLQIIKEIVDLILQKEIRYKTISMCKFTSLIVPGEGPLEVSITLGENESLNATVLLGAEIKLKLKSTFTDL